MAKKAKAKKKAKNKAKAPSSRSFDNKIRGLATLVDALAHRLDALERRVTGAVSEPAPAPVEVEVAT